jgi:hypothetical protein
MAPSAHGIQKTDLPSISHFEIENEYPPLWDHVDRIGVHEQHGDWPVPIHTKVVSQNTNFL